MHTLVSPKAQEIIKFKMRLKLCKKTKHVVVL